MQEDNLIGRQPHRKTISRTRISEVDTLTGGQTYWKTTLNEDNLIGRKPHRKMTSQEYNLTGRQPHKKTASQEDSLTGRQVKVNVLAS